MLFIHHINNDKCQTITWSIHVTVEDLSMNLIYSQHKWL